MNSGIYRFYFTNGTFYIGKSQDMAERWLEHAEAMKKGTAAKRVQAQYILCGLPEFEVLVHCHKDHVDLLEAIYINKFYGSINCLNTQRPGLPPDAEILETNTELLAFATSDHLLTILNLVGENKSYLDTISEYETSDVVAKSTHTALAIKYASAMTSLVKLEDEIEEVLSVNRSLVAEASKPWYKKLFS